MTPGKSAVAALHDRVEACRKTLPSRTNQLHPCQSRGTALHHPPRRRRCHIAWHYCGSKERQGWWTVRPGMCGTAISLTVKVLILPLLKRQPCYNKGLPRSAHTELLKHVTYLIAVSAKAPGLGCVYPMTLPPSWESLQDCCSTVYTHILVGVETKPLASHANMPVHTEEEHSSSFQRAWRAIHAFPREALREVPLYFDKWKSKFNPFQKKNPKKLKCDWETGKTSAFIIRI